MNNPAEKYNVAVIGGGPAGLMAAIQAAQSGQSVILIEKNHLLGKKLLLTGKGRCNLTQAEFNHKKFVEKLGPKGKFLFSSLADFGPKQLMEFFETNGLDLKVERGQRVFPQSDKANDIIKILLQQLKKLEVKILLDSDVKSFHLEENKLIYLNINNDKVAADHYIICTGGKSYPLTGSTGDGYAWAKKFGHTIVKPNPSLVPMRIKENWIRGLQGLSLKNVQINVFQNNKKVDSRFGEMIFTHYGISGPIVLDLSQSVGNFLKKGAVKVEIDFKPALDFSQLDQRLQRDFQTFGQKDFKNYLPEILPAKAVDPFIFISKIPAHRKVNTLTKEERKQIIKLLKNLTLNVDSLMGFDLAIVTSGGVALKEVDNKTMRSKIIDNLSFAGEVLNIDGPTGGYNLQICWSTGYAAGKYAKSKA